MYPQSTLPSLAPASSFSPAAPHDTTMLTSSFRVGNTTPQAGTTSRVPPPFPEPNFPQSSPMSINQQLNTSTMPYQSPSQPRAPSTDNMNGTSSRGSVLPPRPERPENPYTQFVMHMRPQLEADYPDTEIPSKIQYEWENLSEDNRQLWQDRYLGQMQEYEKAMDAWKKARREGPGAFPPVSNNNAS